MPECNGNTDTLSYEEQKALYNIAKAVESSGTAAKLERNLKIKTRPMGKVAEKDA